MKLSLSKTKLTSWLEALHPDALPYVRYLALLAPFVSVLHSKGRISTWEALLFAFSFVFQMASGFLHNTFCDRQFDPPAKNPITSGLLSDRNVIRWTVILNIVGIAIYSCSAASTISLAAYLFYCWIWFAYNGIGIRFKERPIAPWIASLILWAGPAGILLLQAKYIDRSLATLWLGVFILFTGREIQHTLYDYKLDLAAGCKTFSVTYGPKKSNAWKSKLDLVGISLISLGLLEDHSWALAIVVISGLLLNLVWKDKRRLYGLARECLIIYGALNWH